MIHRTFLETTTALVAVGLVSMAMTVAPVYAQGADDEEIESITVTGSYIKRKSLNSPSPVSVFGRSDFDEIGAIDFSEVIRTMPYNIGSEFSPDAFTQNATTGTGQFNLRGMGLNSTLVLINGRRQTTSAILADDGSSFVDTGTLVPMIAIERVEILKDGAAALYGTDAVAGVVNFITRNNFEGAELRIEGQQTTQEEQKDGTISAIFGAGGERTHIVAAFSFLDRSELSADERSQFTAGTGLSTLGQPGAFIPLGLPTDPGLAALFLAVPPGTPFKDPACATGPGPGVCNFDFTGSFPLVPKESRFQGYTHVTHEITEQWEFFGEMAFARNRASRGNSPSFPLLSFPVIPANAPGNFLGVPAVFLGRLLGGDADENRQTSTHKNDMFRGQGGFRGDLNNGWFTETVFTFSTARNGLNVVDQITSRLNNAFNGLGGPGCNTLTGTPGVGDCQFLSPFAGADNDPDLLAFVTGQEILQAKSSLITVDSHITGELLELPAGPLSIAVGGQYRKERFSQNWDSVTNGEDFVFVFGNPDFALDREIWAAFVETSIPVFPMLELQLALRYEDYGAGVGDTWDPKVALLFTPRDDFSIRGSFGTSFRAPSLHQSGGTQTSLGEIIDPASGGARVFRAVRSKGNAALKPETADVFNVGFSWEPVEGPAAGFAVSVDYWRFDYTNLITRENAQAIVTADPFDPRITRSAGGQISLIEIDFINAASLEADGIDLAISYNFDMGNAGSLRLSSEWTYVNSFDIQLTAGGPVIKGAGSRNFTNFARTMPEWRGNVGANWLMGNHSASAWLRYTDSYTDDQNDVKIRSHTTVDLQYSYLMPSLLGHDEGTTLTVGAINVFDRDPPGLLTNGGFDSKVHDPRGRIAYFKVIQPF